MACAAAAVGALTLPSSASAAVSCNLAGNVLTVNVTGTGDQVAGIRMTGGINVGVYDTLNFSAPVACGGMTATVFNTGSIAIADTEPGVQRTIVAISQAGGNLTNTASEGAGRPEIEITYDGGDEPTDDLILHGAPDDGGPGGGDDRWRMGELPGGAEGFQLEDIEPPAASDVDDLVTTNVEQLQAAISGNPGDDVIDARGGTGFTGPLTPGSTTAQLVGGAGDDQIFAGDGNGWFLEGDDGADTLIGGPGDDSMQLSFGTEADTADGNGGTDFCSYQNHGAAVNVDLRTTGPQNTGGAGTDTIAECESLVGSDGADTLIGSSGPNGIFAGPGNDTLLGLGGDDTLNGGDNTDTVSYAQGSAAPVSVNLGTAGAQNTVGAGNDTIANMENLTGSQFGDTLIGSGTANTIDGYDGVSDDIDCVGAGDGDTAISDEAGVDEINNCETTDNAPRVSLGAAPADGALLNDPTPAYALTADEAATFEVAVDGGAFTPCAASCEPAALADGQHTLEFRATDADENLHPGLDSVSRTVTIDTVAPDLQITGGPTASTDDTTPTFTFAAAGATTIECRVDGQAFAACSGPEGSHTTGVLAAGAHTFEVRAIDAAGNPAAATRAFTVTDTKAPQTTITKVKVKSDRAKIRFVADEAGSTFQCKLDKRPFRPCSSPLKLKNLDPGRHKVKVFATDAAGNKDASPAKARFGVSP